MTIENFLINDIKPLTVESDLQEALSLMEEYRFTHYPVLNSKNQWMGNLSYDKLITEINVIESIVPDIIEEFSISEEEFYLSSISNFGTYKANIIPVVNDQKNYLGYVMLEDLMTELSKYPLFNEHFNWISIQNTTAKFAMSEVTKILESNNAKSFGVIINAQDENTTSAHIKFQAENIDSLIQTFERFSYSVKVFKKEGEYINLMSDRYDNLLRYMEI